VSATVTVRYFAAAREAAGRESETVPLPVGATVAALFADLARRHPALRPLEGGLRFAVGEAFAQADAPLQDGDTVVLIPPVSGG
jgi:molybdopterin synthase sulfur carrier subunit